MAMGEYDELDLDDLEATANSEDRTDGEKELANTFGVGEDDAGYIVMRKRPPSRITHEAALNLAAWIIAVTEADIHDVEELARRAVESL